ncbi:MAG: gamma-glutamyltransferase [Geminicoccaceae bacterium]
MRDFQLTGRSPALAQRGMAATSHPAATLAALDVLRAGGNAIDAAVAAVAVQCVVDPHMTGIGGDCFALVAPASGGVVALNGSGRAPGAATLERMTGLGLTALLPGTAHCVTVPGAVGAWATLLERFGTRSLGELLQPAIRYAEDGFVVTPRVAWDWARHAERLRLSEGGKALYLFGGAAPEVGRVLRLPVLGRTLRRIAEAGAAGFYEGEVAARMVATLQAHGGVHTAEDFATATADFVEPIHTRYRDTLVYECPPNGQGIVALILLNILEGYELAGMDPDGALRLHLESEASKLAYRERDRHLTDPNHADVPVARLLDKRYAAALRELIDPDRVMPSPLPSPVEPHPDTVYLTVVDRDLNAVSFINSVYDAFGSGIVCSDTGVLFQSRGRSFRLDPEHPNVIAPGKRPMHTIIPGMAFRDGQAWMSFGVMGGDYQPVGHAHVISNVIDFGMDPQAAIESPRVMAYPGDLEVERSVPAATREGLARRGHRVVEADAPHGGGQAILIDRKRGVLVGGSDPRKDGLALGY